MFNTFSILFVRCVWSIMLWEENETAICFTGRLLRCGMCLNSPPRNWQRVTWSWSANFKSSSRKSRNMWRNKPKIIRRYGSCRHLWCLINIHVSLHITCHKQSMNPVFQLNESAVLMSFLEKGQMSGITHVSYLFLEWGVSVWNGNIVTCIL